MDKGVRADYLDRQFKAETDEVNYRRSRLTDEAKRKYYGSKSRHFRREFAKDLSEFKMVQEARPLKPPRVR